MKQLIGTQQGQFLTPDSTAEPADGLFKFTLLKSFVLNDGTIIPRGTRTIATVNGVLSAALEAPDDPTKAAPYHVEAPNDDTAKFWHSYVGPEPIQLATLMLQSSGVEMTTLQAALATKEDALGLPAANGYVLASDTDGTRTWVAQAVGDVTQAELDAEATSRQTADAALQLDIDAETAARIAADTALAADLDAEEAARIAADAGKENAGTAAGLVAAHAALAAATAHPDFAANVQTVGDARYPLTSALPETVGDLVAALLQAGTGISLTYNDVLGSLIVALASVVGAKQTTLAFTGGWQDYGAPFEPAGYYVFFNKLVVCVGSVKNTASPANGSLAGEFPVGHRPAGTGIGRFNGSSTPYQSAGGWSVALDGKLYWEGGTPLHMTLTGVWFVIA